MEGAEGDGSRRLKVLSWNVHGLPAPFSSDRRGRLQRIAAQVAAEAPDIVAFQEAWIDCPQRLAGHLPGYAAQFLPLWRGAARGGLMILVRESSAWQAAGSPAFRAFTASGPPWRVWQGDGLAGKGALFVELSARDSGGGLVFVGAHLQARYRGASYGEVRLAQIRELSDWLRQLGSTGAIIAGDFNTPPEETEVFGELAALGIDVTRPARLQPGAVTNYPVHSHAGWIDYVFLRAQPDAVVEATARRILNRAIDDPFSDHHGVIAEIVLRRWFE